MAKPRPVDDSDIVSALTLVLIFMSIMAGREIGGLYASYDEFKNLKVLFSVTEEEMSGYLRDALSGEAPDLGFGLAITLPAVDDETKLVRWRRVEYDFEETARRIEAIGCIDNRCGERLKVGM